MNYYDGELQAQQPPTPPAATPPPPPTGRPTGPPPLGPIPGAGARSPRADMWAVLLAMAGSVFMILPSFQGLLLNPDGFVPVVLLRFIVAGLISLLVWALVRPRRPNVFLVSFAIVCTLAAVAVFAAN